MPRLVVAEDDPKQADLIRIYAEDDGHTVTVVTDGRAALEEVRRDPPDLLVLDLMLPRVSGLDVCRILRSESTVPILMVTARSSEDDILLGLDLGADDYVVKPFSPRQLVARVRAVLRRASVTAAETDAGVVVGSLEVDPERHEVRYGGEPVPCTPSEFTVLELLARTPGRVFTREQVIDHLHGASQYVSRRTVDMHVMNLRRKLGGAVEEPIALSTVFGVGYRLTEASRDVG